MQKKYLESLKKFLHKFSKLEDKRKFLGELIEIIKIEGRVISPKNFIWKILNKNCLKEPVITCDEKIDPADIPPVLVASILKHGQLIPAFVTPDGKIIDGKKRHLILKDELTYLILPESLEDEEILNIQMSYETSDACLNQALEIGEKRFYEKLKLKDNNNYSEEIRKIISSIGTELSLPEKVSVYVLLKEKFFWERIILKARKRIKEIERFLKISIIEETKGE